MNTAESEMKQPTKPTGRKYASVADLLRGEGASQETQDRVAELENETKITRKLACMRSLAGITQQQMAEKLGVTQGCVSKWESGTDEELTLKIVRDYCRATDERVAIAFGKPLGHVEAVKMHAWGLRDRLRALANIAQGDGGMEKAIQAFFGEAFFNLLDIFEKCQREMPNSEDFEIRLVVNHSPPKQIGSPCSDRMQRSPALA